MILKTAVPAAVIAALILGCAVPGAAQPWPPGPELAKTVKYDLDVRIDYDKKRLDADCRMTVLNPSETPAARIPLLLYRLLRVESIKGEDGRDLPFRQQVVTFEDRDVYQANFIEVDLAAPLPRDGQTTLDIRYGGYLAGYAETGSPYIKDKIDPIYTVIRPDCLAYPEVGVPSWAVNRTTGLQEFGYRVRVTVPDSLTAANGGRLVDKTSKDGLTTWVYENILPAWRIDIAVADYGILEDRKLGMRVFHFKEDEEGARRILDGMTRCTALFTDWFGPLAQATEFTVIEVPEGFGSQADVSCVLQTRDSFRDPARLNELYHEISHLWNVIPRDPFPARFESEGLATFLERLAHERLEDKPGYLEGYARRMLTWYQGIIAKDPRVLEHPMIDYGRERLTNFSYSEGFFFFYILYKLAGEEAFLKTVGSVYREFHPRGATSREFLDHFAEGIGFDLESFYQAWIYTPAASRTIKESGSLEDLVSAYLGSRWRPRRTK